ncbi:sensor histidine kinase [Pseudalkalibacillus sp. R45]|uniref:sensor histidine kinase n=1 Tax=Pseudalkalibacillus sp. R45 TaxID=3457433 RepID=UPI003FCD4B7B
MKTRPSSDEIASYIIGSQEEERKRVASELHEGVSQTVYSLYSGLQLVENQLESGELKNLTHDLIQMARRTLDELRTLSNELYPHTLERLGIYQTIRSYLDIYSKTFGILVYSKSHGLSKELTEVQNITVFRACQEIILNAATHADTTQINVDFEWKEHELLITIEDTGIGFDIEKLKDGQNSGLSAVMYQLSMIKSEIMVESSSEVGTRVTMKVPYELK